MGKKMIRLGEIDYSILRALLYYQAVPVQALSAFVASGWKKDVYRNLRRLQAYGLVEQKKAVYESDGKKVTMSYVVITEQGLRFLAENKAPGCEWFHCYFTDCVAPEAGSFNLAMSSGMTAQLKVRYLKVTAVACFAMAAFPDGDFMPMALGCSSYEEAHRILFEDSSPEKSKHRELNKGTQNIICAYDEVYYNRKKSRYISPKDIKMLAIQNSNDVDVNRSSSTGIISSGLKSFLAYTAIDASFLLRGYDIKHSAALLNHYKNSYMLGKEDYGKRVAVFFKNEKSFRSMFDSVGAFETDGDANISVHLFPLSPHGVRNFRQLSLIPDPEEIVVRAALESGFAKASGQYAKDFPIVHSEGYEVMFGLFFDVKKIEAYRNRLREDKEVLLCILCYAWQEPYYRSLGFQERTNYIHFEDGYLDGYIEK